MGPLFGRLSRVQERGGWKALRCVHPSAACEMRRSTLPAGPEPHPPQLSPHRANCIPKVAERYRICSFAALRLPPGSSVAQVSRLRRPGVSRRRRRRQFLGARFRPRPGAHRRRAHRRRAIRSRSRALIIKNNTTSSCGRASWQPSRHRCLILHGLPRLRSGGPRLILPGAPPAGAQYRPTTRPQQAGQVRAHVHAGEEGGGKGDSVSLCWGSRGAHAACMYLPTRPFPALPAFLSIVTPSSLLQVHEPRAAAARAQPHSSACGISWTAVLPG